MSAMQKHNIIDANRFSTWEHVLQKPKMADAVIITMPDDLHYEPVMQALAKAMMCSLKNQWHRLNNNAEIFSHK